MGGPDETSSMSGSLGPRFVEMRTKLGFQRQEDFAEKLARSRNTISAYERGKQTPDGETLLRLATLGVNIQWLLTGDGCMFARQSAAKCEGAGYSVQVQSQSASLDGNLMGRIVDTIRAVYKAEGQAIPDRSLGELAAEWYGTITSQAAGPGDRLDALAEHQIALRRRLRTATTHPTSDKRPA